METCTTLNIAFDKGDWLEDKLQEACDIQQWTLTDLIDENTPRLDDEAEIAAFFETWWLLEGDEDQTLSEFRSDMEEKFDEDYNDLWEGIEHEDPMIECEEVPDNCNSHHHDTYDELLALKETISRHDTLKKWLAEMVERACDEHREAMEAMVTSNMPRLEESEDNQNSLLVSLWLLKEDEAANMPAFVQLMNDKFELLEDGLSHDTDLDITVPTVPEGCQPETHQARDELAAFAAILDRNLTFEAFLNDELQECCNEQTPEIS